jgi:hypothetical protein
MDGAVEYMDEVTLCYPQVKFNKLRTVLGFKQDSELTELIEQAEAFYIVRQKDTGEMVAFMTPMVPHRFVPTPDQIVEEPPLKSEVLDVKANLLYNRKNSDKIAENLRVHKKSINMKMLLKENVPAFHAEANAEAKWKIYTILNKLFDNKESFTEYYGEFEYHYKQKYKKEANTSVEALLMLIDERLTPHMASRVGIENWPVEAVLKWVKNYFGAKRLPFVITEAHELWLKKQKLEQKNQQH